MPLPVGTRIDQNVSDPAFQDAVNAIEADDPVEMAHYIGQCIRQDDGYPETALLIHAIRGRSWACFKDLLKRGVSPDLPCPLTGISPAAAACAPNQPPELLMELERAGYDFIGSCRDFVQRHSANWDLVYQQIKQPDLCHPLVAAMRPGSMVGPTWSTAERFRGLLYRVQMTDRLPSQIRLELLDFLTVQAAYHQDGDAIRALMGAGADPTTAATVENMAIAYAAGGSRRPYRGSDPKRKSDIRTLETLLSFVKHKMDRRLPWEVFEDRDLLATVACGYGPDALQTFIDQYVTVRRDRDTYGAFGDLFDLYARPDLPQHMCAETRSRILANMKVLQDNGLVYFDETCDLVPHKVFAVARDNGAGIRACHENGIPVSRTSANYQKNIVQATLTNGDSGTLLALADEGVDVLNVSIDGQKRAPDDAFLMAQKNKSDPSMIETLARIAETERFEASGLSDVDAHGDEGVTAAPGFF